MDRWLLAPGRERARVRATLSISEEKNMPVRSLISAFALLASVAGPAAVALAQDAPVTAPAPAVAPSSPPKLIIAISVDQFSADLFSQYRQRFTGGLARLAGGVVFPSGYQAHAATETCPGHSTILTGSHPGR